MSMRERDEPLPTRILLSDSQLVFATKDTNVVIALADVFDIAQDVSPTAAPGEAATMTLGFKRGESRETVTIECRAETLKEFQFALFKLALDDTQITLKQAVEGDRTAWDGRTASLEILKRGVRLSAEGTVQMLAREAIERFNTARQSVGSRPEQPTVMLYTQRDGRVVQTTVCLPSFRVMNLLGRYLQSSLEAGTRDEQSERSSTRVLLVDNDPGDLEMTELMLKQQDETLQVSTATSAAGGMKLLQREATDCVVSDYDMPGTDGIGFLQQLREANPDLPFILFTGEGSESVAKRALLSDVTDYVEKGIGTRQYEILLSRIRKAR